MISHVQVLANICYYLLLWHCSNKVYESWFNEVLATRHAERRRQRLC